MASERRGPFDRILNQEPQAAPEDVRPDRAGVYIIGTIIGLALLLLILVLPPISILSRGGGSDSSVPSAPADASTYTATVRSGMPKLPAGLTAASSLFDLAAPADQRGASRITLPLKDKQADAHNLAMYSYVDGSWQRLAEVTLVSGGSGARGEVSALPGNIVVLKRSKATLQVAGSLPAGTTLDPGAEPALTTLHPIVFIATADGGIIGNPPAVPPASYKVVPAVVGPNTDAVNAMLRSPDLTSKHAQAIAKAVKDGNYAGISVDYPGIDSQLKDRYTAFVSELAKALHDDGRTLTLVLPMPQVNGATVDTGAYDWQAVGKDADSIELAGELDQDLYFQRTDAALKYVTDKVDRSKVLITINSLSIERGGDGLRQITLSDAFVRASVIAPKAPGDITPGTPVQLVAQNLAQSEGASGMHWDDNARSVTYSYPGRGGKRTVWISNEFSASFRVQLAKDYNLGGVAISDVSVEGGGGKVWVPVQQLADTGSLTLVRPNGEMLTPTWSTSDGTINPNAGDTVTWTTPPTPGSYTVVLVVSDGMTRAGQQLSLDVVTPP